MSTTPQQIHILFDAASQPYATQWQAVGQDILQRATAEMQQEGTAASIALRPAEGMSGERGLGWDDVILNIAGNAAAALLMKAIGEFVHWIHRGTSHSNLPRCIELQAGDATLRIYRDAIPEDIYKELTAWVPQALTEGQINIRFET